ncbi:DNA-directed RNA polymerase V subunit 5A-like isoform X2 [Hibiscus syriacus]|uniref:DNA-directed RNA polymerase V subunit 5A-like isoform X2 n=1 Tax=Hibiscus syriacus TaxID=106335 RepID=UPI001923FF69|nr:DNA-directed RNA polymerase V subunit 5A-like isoform X2 [Hibiscus syriacus]
MKGNGLEGDGSNGEALGKCLSGLVDDGSTESHRYYLSRRTVLEMLRDRGYAVPNSEIDLSLQEFRNIHGQSPDFDSLRLSVTHKTDPSKRMLVVFYGPGMVKVSGIRLIAGLITNKESLTGLILIVQNHMTNQALKALDLFSFKVEIFQHVLKPKHQVLTEHEKQRLLQKYSIEEKQLPRLLKKDAIARYYGFEKGQVVKVTYGGEITESHVTFRCVW